MPKNKESDGRYGRSQLCAFSYGSYLERTSRPLYSLVFLLPFLIFYEFGTIFLGGHSLIQDPKRVVAFVWLQNFTEYLGFSGRLAFIITPLVVVIILLALQITSRKSWQLHFGDLLPMAVECLLLAVPLMLLNFLLNRPTIPAGEIACENLTAAVPYIQYSQPNRLLELHAYNILHILSAGPVLDSSLPAEIVTAVGAGIYEELVFRLILICFLMLLFQNILALGRKNSIILSVVIAAALFSAHHHIIYINGQLCRVAAFTWPQFIFRTIAGVYFAALFAVRGFGITAGTHASYNIIASLVNIAFVTSRNF
jgi:hypothetical protein